MRVRRLPQAAALLALAAAAVVPSTAAAVTPSDDPLRVARAMSAQPKLVIAAKWVTGPSSPSANGVSGPAGAFLPTEGTDFAVLTTGDVANADPPNNSTEKTKVNGTTARFAHDVSTLQVDVIVPRGHNCLGVDLVYYSEEFPENVGSSFNDFFIAEHGKDDWLYDPRANTVNAPNNFAFDRNRRQLSVNSALTSPESTFLQYDGSTVALRARKRVSRGFNRLYFTIADGGDKAIDSAAFLDRLGTANVPFTRCGSGALPADRDADGLPDEWEANGVDTNRDGKVDLDLPAFGASPNHKDLFVEMDAMRGHRLDQAAMTVVMRSFDRAPVPNPDGRTGIHLHVDNGPDSIMNPRTFQRWGGRSESTANIAHDDVLGSGGGDTYNWTEFDNIKSVNLSDAREVAFRYALSIHQYGNSSNFSSGLARGFGTSDFFVSLGRTCTGGVDCTFGTAASFAGTFMHELGHTLGLRHGGDDDLIFKPNYVSVMNYLWQFGGVQAFARPSAAPAVVPRRVPDGRVQNVEPTFDYSRGGIGGAGGLLGTLDENALNENVGVPGFGPAARFLTNRVCGDTNQTPFRFNEGVDWNCNGTVGGVVSTNITNDQDASGNPILGVLTPFDDWSTLRYKGGAVGGFGLDRTLPRVTPNIDRDATVERLQQAARAIEGDAKKPKLRVRRKRRGKRVTVTFTATDEQAIDRLVVTARGKRKTAVAPLSGNPRRRLRASVRVRPGRRVRAVAFDRGGNQVGRKVRARAKRRGRSRRRR